MKDGVEEEVKGDSVFAARGPWLRVRPEVALNSH